MEPKNTNYKFIVLGLAAIGIILLGALWIWGNSRDEAARDARINQEKTVPDRDNRQTPGTDAQVRNVNVSTRNFAFTPNEIRVKKGERVRLTLSDTQGFHDWVLDEFNARTRRVNPGETVTIEFVADRTGTFEYYCSVGNHRQMGMVGKFVVE